MPGPLLVCDLPLLMYRSFFALPKSIKGAEGKPVNALLGVANAVLSACEAHNPRAVVLCDGAEGGAYRFELFPDYHAGREPMPDQLAWQFEAGKELWAAFGWKLMDAGDLEADDLLATLALLEEKAGGETLILTGDRDLLQCVTAKTRVLLVKPGKDLLNCGPAEVEEITGVRPDLIPDLIALRGDPSDGIPGAPGIGAKTAVDLLNRHGSLADVLAAHEGERPSVARSLGENGEMVKVFRRVATVQKVKCRLPGDCPTDSARGSAAAEQLGMKRLAARLRA